jgi:hypothetical protein
MAKPSSLLFAWALLSCRTAPQPPLIRGAVEKKGDQVVSSTQKVKDQELTIRQGHLEVRGEATYRLEDSRLRALRDDPFPRITAAESSSLELVRAHVEDFGLRLNGNASATLADSAVGRIVMANRSRLSAARSRIAELVVADEARVELTECTIDDLALTIQGVSVEFKGLTSGPPSAFRYDGRISCFLQRTSVRRWKFILGNGTHATFERCGDLAIVFQVRDEVATLDDLAPGTFEELVVGTRGGAINVALRNSRVDEWGLIGKGEAVLGARRSTIGEATAEDRSRVLLISSRTSGRVLQARDSATLELDQSEARAGDYHARNRGRIKLTGCTVEPGAKMYGWDDAIIESWRMARPPFVRLGRSARFLVEGHPATPQ